jgi:hypothetical protein
MSVTMNPILDDIDFAQFNSIFSLIQTKKKEYFIENDERKLNISTIKQSECYNTFYTMPLV